MTRVTMLPLALVLILASPVLADVSCAEEWRLGKQHAIEVANDESAVWRCTPTWKRICDLEICRDVKPTVYVTLNFAEGTYQRCDDAGCDSYAMQIERSGIYITATPVAGTFLKALSDGSSYMEVATLGEQLYISRGSCQR